MSYNPKQYWQDRKDPNSQLEVPIQVEDYIYTRTEGQTILDYGVGKGRMLYLYKGFSVTGLDFVDTYREDCLFEADYLNLDFKHVIGDISDIKEQFDNVIVAKVLLHILPENIAGIIDSLKAIGDRVIVWDAVGQDAPHVFDHDFSKYGTMKDVQQWDNELLFIYEN